MFTGSCTVGIFRSSDLQTWEASKHGEFIHPTAADATVAPLAAFNRSAARKGFGPMQRNPAGWDTGSNDADVCCLTPPALQMNESWLVWGVSDQCGHTSGAKVSGNSNAVGRAAVPLDQLLPAYFEEG